MDGPDCYVAGALAAILRVSRLGGLAPVRFVKKGPGWRVSFSPGWSYYGYFIVSVIIVASVGALAADLQLEQVQSVRMRTSTRRVVWIVDVACMLLIAGTSVFGAPAHVRAMILCMNHIEKINFDLNIRHWPMHYERNKTRVFFIWMTATVILTVVDYLMQINDSKMTNYQIWITAMYSFYYCCYWILQLREISFMMIVLHVMYCLRSINDSLKILLRELADSNELPLLTLFNSNLQNDKKKKLSKVNVSIISDYRKLRSECIQKSRRPHESIRRLGLAFANTCGVMREVDAAHGLIVLMMLGSFLLHLVCTPYYVITCMLTDNYSSEITWTRHEIYVGVQLVWCFFHATNLITFIEPCHLTHMEIETTCELVSHLMRCTDSINDPLAIELEIFFKNLSLNQASYSIMHVTTISRSLVATILGSITTYLVIIIQLQ